MGSPGNRPHGSGWFKGDPLGSAFRNNLCEEGGKAGWAREELGCNRGLSQSPIRSFGAGMALQRCPVLRHGAGHSYRSLDVDSLRKWARPWVVRLSPAVGNAQRRTPLRTLIPNPPSGNECLDLEAGI